MLSGVQLGLWIGPVVPIRAPRAALEALEAIEVVEDGRGQSGFELTFLVPVRSPLHTMFLLSSGAALPMVRVVVAVTLNARTEVLIDGVVTESTMDGGGKAGQATLKVTGKDLTAAMDQKDLSGFPFPALPAEGRVALLLLKYAVLGVVPIVVPSIAIDTELPTSKIAAQRGTDYRYMKALAEQVGYVFYHEAGPTPGVSRAYWGPEIKLGVPQRSLCLDTDARRNVESLSFAFDTNKNAIPTLFWYEERSKAVIPVPLPSVNPLNPPLGLIPPIPMRLAPVARDLAKFSFPKALMIGLAKASRWAEAATGRGELDVLRYGAVLRPRGLVAVRGAGLAFDGLHYVRKVTHRIRRGEYKQSFELLRNGLISTVDSIKDRAA